MIYEDEESFYCYNPKLFIYLTKDKHIQYESTESNTADDRIYAIFNRTDQLAEAIREYRVLHNI